MAVTRIDTQLVLDGTLTDSDVNAANLDGVAGTPSMRTLGTGAQQACAGNDARLSDDRTASGLRTATTIVAISGAAAPSAGQVLVALTASSAEWQDQALGLTDANFVDSEVPSGTINGSNAVFTLANTPVAGSEHIYLQGVRMRPGAGNDYTISGATVTFEAGQIPPTGSNLLADYRVP